MPKTSKSVVLASLQKWGSNSDDELFTADAVRLSLNYFSESYPGHAVELRVPPYRVVQVMDGSDHRRGIPPAVVEIDATTWLDLLCHKIKWDSALDQGLIKASGQQSNLAEIIESF